MHEELVEAIGKKIPEANPFFNKVEVGDSSINVDSRYILPVCKFLKNEKYFDVLQVISAVDYLPVISKEGQPPLEGYIEICYILASFTKNLELILKTRLPRGNAGDLPEIDSVCSIWPAANFQEREAYDMMGIKFIGHPDLRRILTSQNWEGHPLRKDYIVQEVFNGMVVNPPEKMNLADQQFGVKNNATSMSNKNPMGM